MLTGQHPFSDELGSSESADPWEIWQTLATNHAAAPPSTTDSVGVTSSEQAQKIDRLTLDLMAKDAKERPTMAQVSGRVKNLLDQYPIAPVPFSQDTPAEPKNPNPNWPPAKIPRVVLGVIFFLIVGYALVVAAGIVPKPGFIQAVQGFLSGFRISETATVKPPEDALQGTPGEPMPSPFSEEAARTAAPTASPTPKPTPIEAGAQFAVNGFTGVYLPPENPTAAGNIDDGHGGHQPAICGLCCSRRLRADEHGHKKRRRIGGSLITSGNWHHTGAGRTIRPLDRR